MKTHRVLMLFVVLLLPASCGYQVRGTADLPASMQHIYIQASRSASPLNRELRRVLVNNGNELVTARSQADAVLIVTRDEMRRRVLTVSETTRVQEFMLDYNVEFRVTDRAGKVLVPAQKLELHLAYEFSETQVLGKSGQEDVLRAELHREMAGLMLDRIAASTGA